MMTEPKTPGPWIVGHPGGPAGPFWSLVNAEGNVVAMQIVEEDDARAMAELHNLRERIEDAIIHYRIGEECRLGLVYVDWEYVCDRMAGALGISTA